MRNKGSRASLFSLLELLLVLAIVLFLANKLFKIYFFQPALDNKTGGSLSSYGIDTQNYKTVLDSTRVKVQEINKEAIERQKAIEAIQ